MAVQSQQILDASSSLDRVAYLVGRPIAHSISPTLHRTLYSSMGKNWGQVLYETEDLPGFMKWMKSDPHCMGSGVTMPYKVAVIPYLDEITPEGKAIGAINTIFLKPREETSGGLTNGSDSVPKFTYCGTNTDCIGIREAFLHNVPESSLYRGKPGLVVGGGGTCRAAVYALQVSLGCSPIYIINRDASEVESVLQEAAARGQAEHLIYVSSAEQAASLTPPGAIVSAVPNFTPVSDSEKEVRKILETFMRAGNKGALLEMCYHPSPKTQIAELTRACGWQVILGTEALIGQGLEQARLWTGVEIEEELRRKVRTAVADTLFKMHGY